MHQQLWGGKVEEKLYVGVREQKRLNTTVIDDYKAGRMNLPLMHLTRYAIKNISFSCALLQKMTRALLTVLLPYLETCAVRKWGKTEEKGDAGYEAGT
jgi:hypothetical protein